MVALRKNGMMDRHWEQVSLKVGKEIKPTIEDFNFSKVIELGLLDHVDACVEIGERAYKVSLNYFLNTKVFNDIMIEIFSYQSHLIFGVKGIQHSDRIGGDESHMGKYKLHYSTL